MIHGCDLTGQKQTRAELSKLTDVTHIFYVTRSSKPTELENCHVNARMLRNVLEAHYAGPFELWGKFPAHEPPFHEDLPRLDVPNFYYALEVKKKEGLTWSVHSLVNVISGLCVYAAICKHERKPLKFLGSQVGWDSYWHASDADLITEQQIWAAVNPCTKNEAFNYSNGDVFKWKHMWKVLAEKFEFEYEEFEEEEYDDIFVPRLEEMMRDRGGVWDDIVRDKGMVATKLEEISCWWVVNICVRFESRLDTINKSKECCFLGLRNSKKSFVSWVDKMKAYKIVP
ncbi:NAD(P)-binding domain containing protein [Parasponia andersonii]|uniref:NAD(P)-binding domain containing protein n=1 Tax=Parasponia andersonii TaxID=3476 RepID=A0A2P5DNB8_PARAD|nr:NAD(P)-binding domain containing protein [Parasponia andersonii]